MTAPHADPLIEGYLARLRAAAVDLTPGARVRFTENLSLTAAPSFPILEDVNGDQGEVDLRFALTLSLTPQALTPLACVTDAVLLFNSDAYSSALRWRPWMTRLGVAPKTAAASKNCGERRY